MKNRLTTALAATGLVLALGATASISDKEKTIVGDGACGRCVLAEAKKCQITIATTEDGKKVTYYLAPNDVAKQFGNQLCAQTKKITVTGTVKTVDAKQELTAMKIELSKE